MPVENVEVPGCFFTLLNSVQTPWTPLKAIKNLCVPTFSHKCVLSVDCLWRLSPASLEFALQSLAQPWLVFDCLDAIFQSLSISTPCFLSLSPSPSVLSLQTLFFFLPLHFSLPPLELIHRRAWERGRDLSKKIKSAGCCVSTWIPTHLVIAVSKPSDNSLNCLPSNLRWDWGEAMGVGAKRDDKE